MWTWNRGHIFRVDGIQCHNIGVFSNVVMQKKRIVSRKTSDWPNSYCSVYERCNNDILFTMKYIEMTFCRDVYWSGCVFLRDLSQIV